MNGTANVVRRSAQGAYLVVGDEVAQEGACHEIAAEMPGGVQPRVVDLCCHLLERRDPAGVQRAQQSKLAVDENGVFARIGQL